MLDKVSLNLLTKAGLNDKQARVYLALLKLGQAGVTQIAEAALLKRSITYVVLDELISHGYVSPAASSAKKRTYAATDPNALASQLEQTAHEFKDMLPYLRAMQRQAGKPHVAYYSGLEGLQKAFSQIRRPKEARYALSVHQATPFIAQEIQRWSKLYLEGKSRPGGRHLLTDTEEDRIYGRALTQGGQVVRYLAKGQDLGMDLALVDGTVFLTTFDHDIHVTVIESETLSHSLALIYDLAWHSIPFS